MDLIVFEDEHLLVAVKPAGWNTHAPAPFAGEGLYEWLKGRSRERASLSIHHRLDKETSGLMVFGKTAEANRSLARQFEERSVKKKYTLWTKSHPSWRERTIRAPLARAGNKYAVRSGPGAAEAETIFRLAGEWAEGAIIEAIPITGRTHQIRAHAAENGFPIAGDALYGGGAWPRLCLHSTRLEFKHPATRQTLAFTNEPRFGDEPRAALRDALIDTTRTSAFRMIHGAADGWPGLYVDKLGPYFLAQSAAPLTAAQRALLASCRPLYHKILRQHGHAPAALAWGESVPEEFSVLENGARFALRLGEGYSNGLFLDQRENRRRLLTGYIAPDFEIPPSATILNAFAYTCGFSVCAALAGKRVASLDLSKNYLAWGRRNFILNGLDPDAHEFIHGDAFDWLRRLARKERRFDVIILDPPTFSRSKESGVFQAAKDYGKLAAGALPLLRPGGILFASTNATGCAPEMFLDSIGEATRRARRAVQRQHYVPQPPDFPIDRDEPAYLKTVWLRVT